MSSNTEKKIKNLPIVSIEPTLLQSYKYFNTNISNHNMKKSSPKSELYVSYIPTKDIIFGTVEVSRRINEEDLNDAVELEAYESLGLDSAIEYKIIHLEVETNSTKNRTFNVFAFDLSQLNQIFSQVKTQTKYIDYITFAPFLFSSVYEKKLIDSDKTDCFIYFQKNDAFLTIYKNGKYLYSKSLNYSLLQINEKFCEALGERIDEDVFLEILKNDGLKTSNITYQQALMQLFGEIFSYINDVIIFFKRSYDVENINNLYLGSEVGNISGLLEYARSYLGIESYLLDFNVAKNKNEWQIDQMHILMMLTGQIYIQEQDENYNITIFKRPPTFIKRPSGLITLLILLALVLSLAFPVFQYSKGFYLNKDTEKKQKLYDDAHVKAQNYKIQIQTLNEQKEQINKALSKEQDSLNYKESILSQIHNKKVNYTFKAVILDELSTLIGDASIHVKAIKAQDQNATISLVSQSNKQLTELLKQISATQKYNVDTKDISFNQKEKKYESNITTKVLK